MKLLDLAGLRPQGLVMPSHIIKQEGWDEDATLVTEEERLSYLARLVSGSGVTVVTGPSGAPFWSLASIEVKVRVVPDGTDYTDRTSNVLEWALAAVGLRPTQYKTYLEGARRPTAAAKIYDAWVEAEALAEKFRRAQDGAGQSGDSPGSVSVSPIVVETAPSTAITDPAEQLRFLDAVGDTGDLVACDWEWDPEDGNAVVGFAVADSQHGYYLPVRAKDHHLPDEHAHLLREAVAGLTRRVPTVWHNARSDLGTQVVGDPADLFGSDIHDTILLAYLSGENELGLKGLTRKHLDRDPLDYPEGLHNLPVDVGRRYAAAGDVRNTYDLFQLLHSRVSSMGMTSTYNDFERPLVPVVASMEKYGTPVDPQALLAVRANLFHTEEAIRSLMYARHKRDIADDKETRALLVDMLGYDLGTLDQRVLSSVPGEWMDNILGYRRLRTRRRNFADKLIRKWEAQGKPPLLWLYPSWNQAGSSIANDPRGFKRAPHSGRFSSSGDINGQNQPRDIREIFVAPEGCDIFSLDYKSLEAVLAAGISGDPEMLRVFVEGLDPHKETMEKFLAMGLQVDRLTAKIFNFSQNYRGGMRTVKTALAKERMFLDDETIARMIDAYAEIHGHYIRWGDSVVDEARRNGGYSETLFGRRRYDHDIFSYDALDRGHAERALINMCVQGLAADVLKRAMVWAQPVVAHFGAHISLQVHDEIVGWVPTKVAPRFIAAMRGIMESIEIPNIRLTVEGGHGKNWAEVH